MSGFVLELSQINESNISKFENNCRTSANPETKKKIVIIPTLTNQTVRILKITLNELYRNSIVELKVLINCSNKS